MRRMPAPYRLPYSQFQNPFHRFCRQGLVAAREVRDDFLAGDIGIARKEAVPYLESKAGWMMAGRFIDPGRQAFEKRNAVPFLHQQHVFRRNGYRGFVIPRQV